jgi:hypothetical protein
MRSGRIAPRDCLRDNASHSQKTKATKDCEIKKEKLGTMEHSIIPWWLLLLMTILLSQMLTDGADSGRAAHHIRRGRRHRESNNEVSLEVPMH